MKNVNIKYFALLRDQANLDTEVIQTEATSYIDLYKELKKTHDFTLCPSMIQVAVDDEFVDKNSEIVENAKVVFIPPVTGG